MSLLAFPKKNRLALTSGEGSGPAAVRKALKKLGRKKGFQLLVYTGGHSPPLKIPSLKTKVFQRAAEALREPFSEGRILEVKNGRPPADWAEEAARLCLSRKLSALITGPVGKASMKKNRLKALGQTHLMKILSKKEEVFMAFLGEFFHVLLFSDHIPLRSLVLDARRLRRFLRLALKAREFLPPSRQRLPLGLLGLNPHAGEGGLIGKEERDILIPLLKNFSKKEIEGPLPPDAAFLKKNWGRYSFYAALYHDQGLIPFKAVNFPKAAAMNIGLPFLRLGAAHGTGLDPAAPAAPPQSRGPAGSGPRLRDKEISGESILMALKEAIRLIKKYADRA